MIRCEEGASSPSMLVSPDGPLMDIDWPCGKSDEESLAMGGYSDAKYVAMAKSNFAVGVSL